MRRIKEHKRLEDNRHQSKGKASATSQYNRNLRSRGFQQRPRREARALNHEIHIRGFNVAFKEPIHKILERIKNEPYFRWLGKMGGDPTRRNQSLYYTYHREKGYSVDYSRIIWSNSLKLGI